MINKILLAVLIWCDEKLRYRCPEEYSAAMPYGYLRAIAREVYERKEITKENKEPKPVTEFEIWLLNTYCKFQRWAWKNLGWYIGLGYGGDMKLPWPIEGIFNRTYPPKR